ncbi:unnamed protein product [Gulo gulo]|uniref:RFX1 transcription activation region domain-containing protein n=1 Tax=Gulo gulo TaxID=48420 RepID=A0A9X9LK13_GULGU|nr:unnamed protein product [Gulo gulo]
MQNAEGGSDSPASVTLCPSAAAQAPVAQPVPASPQRVLVQAAGSAPKGAQMQPISLPRVQQVPQQIVRHRPRKLTIFHPFRTPAFGVQASTSIEHWGTEVDTQTEKPRFRTQGTWNSLGKQAQRPQTSAMTQEVLLVQPLQHVYPPQVQYVEGGDAVYTNGALYVGLPTPHRQAWATSRTFLHDSPHLFPFGPVCAGTSPPPLGDVGPGTTVLGQESPVEISEITGFDGSHFQKRQAFHKTKQNTPQSSL